MHICGARDPLCPPPSCSLPPILTSFSSNPSFTMPRYYTRSKTRSQNRTTMHPTFAVPELRAAICADDVLTRGDLYNLCLVSRGFEAVAAPLLWENLDCLVPLLQLLSRDAWRMRPAEEIKDDSDVCSSRLDQDIKADSLTGLLLILIQWWKEVVYGKTGSCHAVLLCSHPPAPSSAAAS